MAQDWKTLSIIVVGAAMAGWVTVRALSDHSDGRVASPTTAVASPGPRRTTEALAATDAAATPARVAPPASAEPPVAASDTDESDLILRDLELLAQGLVKDQRIEDRVMPRVNDVLDVPGMTAYRRAPDFWESAFAPAGMSQ